MNEQTKYWNEYKNQWLNSQPEGSITVSESRSYNDGFTDGWRACEEANAIDTYAPSGLHPTTTETTETPQSDGDTK